MPATEQTWRDLKILHVVFGVSAIALLVATVAMLAVDHARPWKKYQREFRELETWTAAARVAEQDSRDYEKKTVELRDAAAQASQADLDAALAKAFLEQVRTVAADAQAADFAEKNVAKLASETDPSTRLAVRGDLLERFRDIAKRAKFREDQFAGKLKLCKAQLDKARADYELAVSNEAGQPQLDALLAIADAKRSEVSEANLEQQAANTHRKSLESLLRQITATEDAAGKALADHEQKLAMLSKTVVDRAPNFGKSLLELPVLDAFNSPLKIDQIWLPKLTINNNFRDVARFDRCVTCHKGIDKSAPGAPGEPLYCSTESVAIALPTPAAVEKSQASGEDSDGNDRLEDMYGIRLSPRGLFREEDPTVSVVVPGSPAAEAGVQVGDVIVEVGGTKTLARRMAVSSLLSPPQRGAPIAVEVRRGVPEPYTSHPRLDLFVGSTSPHPMQTFGCTICHEGQGSATSFKWASHTPNSPKQGREWHDEHGWFDNHHWIFPMLSNRFEQSSCLKCHHQVVDLEPSPRFPEPPAEKLVEGYHLIRQYGCYGCHEINGYAGPDKRIGPDMRLSPNYHEVAQAVLSDPGLSGLGPTVERWAKEVEGGPDGRAARERLREAIELDAAAGDDAKLSGRSHQLAVLLKEPETPGSLPKVGPSLRHVKDKVGFDWAYSWLRDPTDFRPSTKMPRFFGLWEHLSGKGLEESERYEPIEIRSMISYLSASSQPFDFVKPYEGITAAPDVERGKKVFQVRGCLACHQHSDFPEAKSTHGPNLSRMGAKVASNKNGPAWLYSWLREPARYHPKTLMPNVLLEPVKLADGRLSDPAADATAYLMASNDGWKPTGIPAADSLTADERKATEELAAMYLKDRFPAVKAEEYSKSGLPPELASIQGDERMLLGLAANAADRDRRLLEYVGKKTIAKLACYSCHDIPGFEDAKPAGAALADWGRKESSKIAFEQVVHFVTAQLAGHDPHGAGHGHHEHGHHGAGNDPHGPAAMDKSGKTVPTDPPVAADLAYASTAETHVSPESVDPDTGYFLERLLAHDRQGFLWQKLRAPRSYDYKKAENKTYNERYRMPKFPFNDEQREAVMTFVLGLVAEPPAPQFVNVPAPREQARLDGLKVAEQYNCGGCHTLEMDRWDIRYRPESLGEAPTVADYPFLAPRFTPEQVAASLSVDHRGRRRAVLHGMPVLDPETGRPQQVDEDGVPVEEGDAEAAVHHPFMLFTDVLVDGEPRPVGAQNLLVPDDALVSGKRYPARGGDLAKLLFPVVIEDEKAINPNVKPDDAWGWLPPPLVGEGRKVQTGWLHRFLLEPHTIRPAAVLRMPKFHFGSEESGKLVNYFAAVDGADFPYDYDARYEQSSLAAVEASHPGHLSDALKIVTNGNYCVKCHLLGSYSPPGNPKALAPQLERIHQRLRPDYTHDWIANPKRFLPYTGMPVNIPFDQPVSQDLYRGTSEQQVAALTDLLMHFDAFAKRNLSLDAFLRQPAPAAGPPAAAPAASLRQPGAASGAAAPAGGRATLPLRVPERTIEQVGVRPIPEAARTAPPQ